MTCACGSENATSARFGHPHLAWCPATDNGPGVLEVGANDKGEVVVNLPRDMTGHIVFSVQQAHDFAHTVVRQALIAAGAPEGAADIGVTFPQTVCPACVLDDGPPVRVRLCPVHRPKGPLTQGQQEAASAAVGWLRHMQGGDGDSDPLRYISGHKLAEVVAALDPLLSAVLSLRAGLPRFDGRRHVQSPGLFGVGIGGSTCGPVTCGWCGVTHNEKADPVDGDPDGEWVGHAPFGDLEVCDCCFAQVELAVLSYVEDIVGWYGKILNDRRARDERKAVALRTVVCTCPPAPRRGMGLARHPQAPAAVPCPVHGVQP